MWHFDRADRLRALARRCEALAGHLARESLEIPRGTEARARLAFRRSIVDARLARLRLLARVARHNARTPCPN